MKRVLLNAAAPLILLISGAAIGRSADEPTIWTYACGIIAAASFCIQVGYNLWSEQYTPDDK